MDDVTANLQGRSQAVFVVSIVILSCATVFVSFRMLSRGLIVRKVSLDDWVMLLAWLLSFGMTFAVCYGTAYGLGRHEDDVPDTWQLPLHKANFAFSVLYNPALMAEKTSILAFYLTLSKTHITFRWSTIATLIVVNAGGLALTLLNVFQCHPVAAVFQTQIPEDAYCTDIVTIYLSSAPLNIITDLAILFIPLPILTGMRLPLKQKIILIITFSFGAFATAVDVVRIAALQSASQSRLDEIQYQGQGSGSAAGQVEKLDFSWYASLSFMWSVIEVNVGIMCGSVPALKPIVSRFLPRMLRDSNEKTEKANSVSQPRPTFELAEDQRVPSVPDHICHQQPPPRTEAIEEAEGNPIDMMDFLTTPDMVEGADSNLHRTQTALTNTSRHTKPASPAFFDFVTMKHKKSMVYMTNRESILPIVMVTVLFFIWGFEYGLLDVLNSQFQQVAHMTPGQTTAIHSAYYAGYLLGPWLFGYWVLHHWGFKACFSVGLSIYACGTLVFWPSAVLTSFPAYLITNMIVGTGLSILEVSANPFIILCGPARYAEVRLNLSQGVQGIGTIIAPLIADRAFLQKSFNAGSLVSTQYAYLGIALFTILLAVAYHYMPLPEATDDELDDAAERLDGANRSKTGGFRTITVVLAAGAFSQFCYVGAQEVNGTGFVDFLNLVDPTLNPSNYLAIAHTAFVVSRFLAAGLGLIIKPRILLLGFYLGCILFQALAIRLSGNAAVAMLIMTFFMEGPLFSLLFAQSMRGQGRNAKLAGVVITSTISGGAAFSPISSLLAAGSVGGQYSLVVAVAVFAAGTLTPVLFNLLPKARWVVDPTESSTDTHEQVSLPTATHSVTNRSLNMLNAEKMRNRGSLDAEYKEHGGS